MIIRHSLLLCFFATLLACSEGAYKAGSSDSVKTADKTVTVPKVSPVRPNIVFIFADDQSPKTIAAHGNALIKTPNIDALANKGVSFSNAYNMGAWNGAVCLASRAMLNTGRSVWDAYAMDGELKQGKGIKSTWAKLMEKQGYDTYMTGKWHVSAKAQTVFNVAKHVRAGMPGDYWEQKDMTQRFADFEAGTSPFKSIAQLMPVGYNRPLSKDDKSWSPTDPKFGGFYEGGKHWSEVVADDALEFIAVAAKKDKPFFMYLAFNAAHDPRQAPQEYQDMYDQEKLPLPANWLDNYPEKDLMGNGPSLRDAALAPFPRTPYATRVNLKEYYALVTHLDTQVGHILKALKDSGKMDNTYVIYTADHGLAVGEHGLFGKQNMYEHSVRAPFIIWGPGMTGGTTVSSDIYIQDAMATSLELAGLEKPDYVFFNSIAGLAKGSRSTSAYKAIYGAYMENQRMIKKDGYKLIVYPYADKVKLFKLANDLDEMNNLADKPEYKNKVHALFKDLLKLQKTMGDQLDLTHMHSLIKKA